MDHLEEARAFLIAATLLIVGAICCIYLILNA